MNGNGVKARGLFRHLISGPKASVVLCSRQSMKRKMRKFIELSSISGSSAVACRPYLSSFIADDDTRRRNGAICAVIRQAERYERGRRLTNGSPWPHYDQGQLPVTTE